MAWLTSTQFYLLTGLTTDDITALDVGSLITIAQSKVLDDVTILRFNENLDGDKDGTNTQFKTYYYPIFDSDFDQSVDENDITVYSVTINSETGWEESTAVTATTVNARDGIITLTSAPASTVNYIRADYRYGHPKIDWNNIYAAMAYWTAVLGFITKTGALALDAAGKVSISDLIKVDFGEQHKRESEQITKFALMYEAMIDRCKPAGGKFRRVEGAPRSFTQRGFAEIADELQVKHHGYADYECDD